MEEEKKQKLIFSKRKKRCKSRLRVAFTASLWVVYTIETLGTFILIQTAFEYDLTLKMEKRN